MSGRVLVAVLLLYPTVLFVSGQQPKTVSSPLPQSTTSAPPQNPTSIDQEDVVRINANLVQIDAVVTKDGKQVTDLKAEDFEIFEDGRPQKITQFSYISNVPADTPSLPARPLPRDKMGAPVVPVAMRPHDVRRTVAVVVDDLGMSFESIARMKAQLRKFIDKQLQPNDLVGIIRTGGDIGALQQFTTDKRVLYSAIDHLRWNPYSRQGLYVFGPSRNPQPTSTPGSIRSPSWQTDIPAIGSLNLGDSMRAFRTVLEGLNDLPGRKSMVIVSDNLPVAEKRMSAGDSGFPEDSLSYRAELQKLAEVAIRSSVVVYGIDTQGLETTGLTARDEIPFMPRNTRPDSDPLLVLLRTRSLALRVNREGTEQLAKQTGGFVIHSSNSFDLQKVMDDQRGYYLIGYRPSDETFDRRFHYIKARVRGRGLQLRTREGFFGVTEDKARRPPLTAGDQMNRALISPFGAKDITVSLTTFFANDATAGSLLRSFLYMEARDLTFVDQPDGWHTATLNLRGVLFGDNGQVVSRQDHVGSVRLKGLAYERALRDGIVYDFDMPVRQSGVVQFRVAVQDAASARIGSAGQVVEVPDIRSGRLSLSGIVIRGAETLHEPGSPSSRTAPAALNASNETRAADDEVSNGPAVRRFRQGTDLILAYAVYNARLDGATHSPQLSTQTRVFRDGRPIFTGDATPIDFGGQADLQRIASASRLQLGAQLTPGEYVLQIIVTDGLGKEKPRVVSRWIDFEVVK
jgi:VWFA-related protein